MSLYWPDDEPTIELNQPRLHALVIAVGDYPHLMGGAGHPAVANFGLQQLTTTIHTGPGLAEWLVASLPSFAVQGLQGYRNHACPLGSIEILLSPAKKVTRPDGAEVAVGVSNMVNIKAATDRWYKRCDSRSDNIAFFYFAGHGLNPGTQLLLASDFGDPNIINLWGNCIDFDGLRIGMTLNKAQTQLFFADACREKPIDALLHRNPSGDPLVTGATIFDKVDASAAYYAAADGLKAFGPSTDVTYFASALLDALEGAGGLNRNGQWRVDTFSLGNALGQITASLASQHNQPLTCNPDPQGLPTAIHFPVLPFVRTTIGCKSVQANDELAILLTRGANQLQSNRGDPRPWLSRVHPGDWDIQLQFLNYPQVTRIETLVPPVFDLEEMV